MATDDLPCMQVLTTARYPRRYKHFNLLDQLLRKEFGPLVPQALPAKRAFGNLHPSFVEERRVALERYLQQCVAIPALAASSLFCHFVEADVKEGADFGEDETALHQSLHRVCTKQVGAAQWRLIAPEWRLIAPEWRRIAPEWRLIATEWRLIAHESTPEWHSAYLIASHCLDSHPIASVRIPLPRFTGPSLQKRSASPVLEAALLLPVRRRALLLLRGRDVEPVPASRRHLGQWRLEPVSQYKGLRQV